MRRVLVIVAALIVVLGGWLAWRSLSRQPAATTVAPAAPVPAPAPPPVAAAPAPAPPPAEPAPTPRRRAAPPPEPAAAPPPEPASAVVGILRIDSDVPGAQVFIDRNFIGVTPVTAPDVAPGSHRFNIVAPGYESIAENLEITAGPRDLRFNFKEVKLDAAIDVVHKHRMGSCKGRLVATPQGVRYDTTDRDDAFSAKLTELDLFEVDYLAKELRVRPAKGKRFAFTDPEANADRLFVFHRDVDKARKRLLEGK